MTELQNVYTPEALAAKFDEAIALLQKGWIRQKSYKSEDGHELYCATGALRRVTGSEPVLLGGEFYLKEAVSSDWDMYYALCRAAEKVLREKYPKLSLGITVYNDILATDVEDVIELFRAAKDRLLEPAAKDGPRGPSATFVIVDETHTMEGK